jgi:hypothetical protein
LHSGAILLAKGMPAGYNPHENKIFKLGTEMPAKSLTGHAMTIRVYCDPACNLPAGSFFAKRRLST